MSILHITYPIQAAMPGAQYVFSSALALARPVFGAGALMSVLMIFKPMLVGVLKAIRLMFSPRQTLDERNGRRTLRGVLLLNRLANEFDQTHPSQAAELRLLAGRS